MPVNTPNSLTANRTYDAVVVGARAAGASTAMLLARRGLRVLAIDKQKPGSDTLSTHALMRGAVDSLHRWGLLDTVLYSTPTISNVAFRYGREEIAVPIKPREGVPGLAAPRRTVLDPILVAAARNAGADVQHETTFEGIERDTAGQICGVRITGADGNAELVHTNLVIGADGLRSKVARLVGSPITRQGTESSAYIMAYFDQVDLPRDSYLWSYGHHVGSGAIPTNDGASVVFAAMPRDRFTAEARADIAGVFSQVVHEADPQVGAAVATARQQTRFRSWPGIAGQFRQAAGPGWALVGDAGYFKDPFAAHGISDAMRDAELLADAVATDTLANYGPTRDRLSTPLFDALERIASYDWDLDSLPMLHQNMSLAMRDEAKTLGAMRAPATMAA